MITLIVIFMICIYTCQSLAARQFAKTYPGDKDRSSQVFSTLYGGIVFLSTLVIALFQVQISTPTLLLGLINGVVLTVYNQMLIKASALGPYSIVMISMVGGGILMPLFWSVLVDKLPLPITDWMAIVGMLLALVLLNMPEKSEMTQKISGKFVLSCAILGIVNGFYAILMSEQHQATQGTENPGMIIITFAASGVFSLLLLLIPHPDRVMKAFVFNRKSIFWALASSVSAAVAVNIKMYLLAKIDIPVLASLNSGGVLLLSVLISAIFFGEKLSIMKKIGVVLAIAAIVLLSV